jgi:hypothetical protein
MVKFHNTCTTLVFWNTAVLQCLDLQVAATKAVNSTSGGMFLEGKASAFPFKTSLAKRIVLVI